MAVNRNYTNANGEREADFINCVVWRKAAENFSNFTNKGSQVGIEGRLQTRNYENKHGQRVYVTEVIVESFYLLETKKQREDALNNQANNQQYNEQANSYDNQSMSNTSNDTQGFYNPPSAFEDVPVDISEDDLPF